MTALKEMSTSELLLARQWLEMTQKEVGISPTAKKYNQLLFERMKDVDMELWLRIVSSKEAPPWKKKVS